MSGEPTPQWRPKWLVALLIGLVTVTAGFFTWRAGQLGSSAAFEDRTSVGQTIKSEEQDIEATLGAVDDTVAYVTYVTDFAEAASLDDLAAELEAEGRSSLAATYRADATEIRQAASAAAVAAGVFGRQTVLAAEVADSTDPLPFDFDTQRARLKAELATGLRSPGPLDPDRWAAQADDTRRRVRGLRLAALVLIVGVAGLTVAELGRRRWSRIGGFALGVGTFVVTTFVTFATVY
jgi:hypothetical protein